jgi:LmbE family N-acetylglucosaminyl deacetylase
VLVLAPHPDDFDAIGVTLRFCQRNGNAITVGVARTGSGVEDSYCSLPTLAVKEAIREKEQRASCRFFGLSESSLTFLDLARHERDQPLESPVNVERLAEFILPRRPAIVFLPHGNDTNSGHRRMYSMFKQVVERADFPVIAFLNRDPKTIAMRDDVFMPFGEEEARWKATLLRFHDSQHQRNLNTRGHGFDERILSVNRQAARKLAIREEYVESFEVEFCGTVAA